MRVLLAENLDTPRLILSQIFTTSWKTPILQRFPLHHGYHLLAYSLGNGSALDIRHAQSWQHFLSLESCFTAVQKDAAILPHVQVCHCMWSVLPALPPLLRLCKLLLASYPGLLTPALISCGRPKHCNDVSTFRNHLQNYWAHELYTALLDGFVQAKIMFTQP